MPSTALAPGDLHLTGKLIAEFIAPSSDRFAAHHDAALQQQLFDITKAQREAEILAHGEANDGGWETGAASDGRGFHLVSLADRFANVAVPSADHKKKNPRKYLNLRGLSINMVEGVGFEPTETAKPRRFSRPVHSTALPALRDRDCTLFFRGVDSLWRPDTQQAPRTAHFRVPGVNPPGISLVDR